MTITILSARYGNEERTSAVVITQERGAVAISELDRPEAWAALLAWQQAGGTIQDPDPVTVVTAGDIAVQQLQKSLALRGLVRFLAQRHDMTPLQVVTAIKDLA